MDILKNFALTIPGDLVAALIGFIFWKRQENDAAMKRAAIEFRSSVLECLTSVYPLASAWPANEEQYFRSVFPRMQIAVNRFRHFIPYNDLHGFDNAWKLYRLGEEGREIDIQHYYHYMGFDGGPEPKKLFKNNVDALLDFTN